jgi:hypothetical protein
MNAFECPKCRNFKDFHSYQIASIVAFYASSFGFMAIFDMAQSVTKISFASWVRICALAALAALEFYVISHDELSGLLPLRTPAQYVLLARYSRLTQGAVHGYFCRRQFDRPHLLPG